MTVVLLIRSLDIGGAQRQLVVLAKGLKARGADVRVLTFYPNGALRRELEAAGVPITDLRKHGRWDLVGFIWRFVRWLRRTQPQVVYSFLPVANIIAVCAKFVLPTTRIVWGVRASNVDLDRYDWLSRVVARTEAKISSLADAVVANSEAGQAHHMRLGFRGERMRVIENGIDTERFRFDAEGRRRVREEWGVGDDAILIGLAARLDPMKDHETFLEAAAMLAAQIPAARFVCVGDGPGDYARQLKERAATLGVQGRLVWAGIRQDMPAVYSAFDIASSSSSFGEGFPNAIAEAMACERICAVTNAGDSTRIVGGTGWTVSPKDAAGLAAAWTSAMLLPPQERAARGVAARRRIVTEFSVARMVEKTGEVLGRQ